MDWTPVLIGLGGGVLGVASGVVVTVMSNRNARQLGRDAARRAAYVSMTLDTRDADRAIRDTFHGKRGTTTPETVTLLLKARAQSLLGSASVRRKYDYICQEFLSFPLIRDSDEYIARHDAVLKKMLELEDTMSRELSPVPLRVRLWRHVFPEK